MDIKRANIVFHDETSREYDKKWAIRYDDDMAGFVLFKFELGFKGSFPEFGRVLEIGCGTGYAMLNLSLAGVLEEAWGCDISQGMLDVCEDNAEKLGMKVHLQQADVENLPYEDEFFDLVIGHAVLHHLPDLDASFREIYRVLKPGGKCVVAGEPTVRGHQFARVAKSLSTWGIKTYALFGGKLGKRRVKLRDHGGSDPARDHEALELEHVVDIHTFRPKQLCEIAGRAGFSLTRFESEELLASFIGWMIRTVEGSVVEENITDHWRWGAYNTYRRCRAWDIRLYDYLPHEWFYNLILYLEK
ncbi:MAG: class I SAM-dependent methyltransferase [Actinomycetota bacterium]|nr:class I SAM-dependent methyltransferase [Actinomycetota bacterium]